MDPDEIVHNPFYHSLRYEFRKKYDSAISKCWTICVPSGNSLRGFIISDNFVDDHILKPHTELPRHFTSIVAENPSLYRFNGTHLERIEYEDSELSEAEERGKVRVLSIERGYNKEFQMYLIFVLDKPLLSKYTTSVDLLDEEIELNRSIASYKEAMNFFNQFSAQAKVPLEKLTSNLKKINLEQFESSEELSSTLKDLTRRYWAVIMRKHTLHLQRDARFQKLLSTALEVFVMHCLHENIYSLLSGALEQEDLYVNNKLVQLVDAGVTPDQLGADESLAISLPAAVVELATLDAREGPLEKFLCLRSTLDLIIAEVKAAIAEVRTKTEDDCGDCEKTVPSSSQPSSTGDLIPLLLYVIVRSRPRRLVTDLHYVHNFLWSVSPQDGMSHSLATFEAAVEALFRIKLFDLPHRSSKVKTELPIGELLDVISRSEESFTPLDTQIHQLATMLEKCTQD